MKNQFKTAVDVQVLCFFFKKPVDQNHNCKASEVVAIFTMGGKK